MTRNMLQATEHECLTQDESLTDDARLHEAQREHKLPFNTDSPAWVRAGQSREAAELRMTQLVKTLESEVIPRLLEAHRAAPTGALPLLDSRAAPTEQEVISFVQLVLAREDIPIHDCINGIRQKGMSVETVYLNLLAPAAKYLGDLWMDDLCDFTEVTVGLAYNCCCKS
jgi:MerR family transcriptional regulator, light-induced transcriptional regulator